MRHDAHDSSRGLSEARHSAMRWLSRCAARRFLRYALAVFLIVSANHAAASNPGKGKNNAIAKPVAGYVPLSSNNAFKTPRKHDPLRRGERERVLKSLQQRNPGFAKHGRRARTFSFDEPVLLLLEKRPPEKNSNDKRLADAYYYDYRRNQAIHCIVDATSGAIIAQQHVENLQLPLIAAEVQRAFDIYLQSDYRQQLANAYREATGQALIDIGKVHFKAYVFHASAHPRRLNKAAKQCGKKRCAQLLLYTHENISLQLMPVIDLSRGKVLQAKTETQAYSAQGHGKHHHDSHPSPPATANQPAGSIPTRAADE